MMTKRKKSYFLEHEEKSKSSILSEKFVEMANFLIRFLLIINANTLYRL